MSQQARKLDEQWVQRILRAFEDLEYGSVQIIVHDGKIVQIERTKKERFPVEKEQIRKSQSVHRGTF